MTNCEQALRCQNCNKKLAMATGAFTISIKCTRCKSLNLFKC